MNDPNPEQQEQPADEQVQKPDEAAAESAPNTDLSSTDSSSAESAAAEDIWWNETAAHIDHEATRPLNAFHAPAEEHIELDSSEAHSGRMPVLYAAALRDIGQVREINQDHIYTLVSTLPREGSDFQIGLFAVADGMGGHEGGEIASQIAISAVVRTVLSQLLVPALEESFGAALQDLMVEAVKEANRAIWDRARAMDIDMGTTCTAALIIGRTVYIGHVGDSRAYLYSDHALRLLTNDHSAVGRLIQLGQLHPSEAREHPMRSQLYRSVGQQPEVHVDFVQCPLGQAEYLILCSDGMWGMIDESFIIDILSTHAALPDMCQALIDLVNAAGGEDNISVVIVKL